MNNNISIVDNADFDFGNLTINNGTTFSYTTGATMDYTNTNYNWTTTGTSNPVLITAEKNSGVIDCKGADADILLDGKSVRRTLEAIEDRLAILQPNPALEEEWAELQELGRRYRELEAEIKQRMKVWDILKKT